MKHLHALTLVLWLGLLLPVCCPSQTINRGFGMLTSELVDGLAENLSLSTNVAGTGTATFQLTSSTGNSYGRSSATANSAALRFALKATAHGGSGHANAAASYFDRITIVSPNVTGYQSGTARIRLLVSAQRQLAGTTNPYTAQVSISLNNWGTNSQMPHPLPNGELLVDLPVYIDGPSPTHQTNEWLLIASASASATGTAETSATVSGSLVVTLGGIVSLKLDDDTPITDFEATGALGRDYRFQRPRPDHIPTISRMDPSTIALQWAGTSNFFYQVEASSSLAAESWLPVGGVAEGNETNALLESIQATSHRFYRVIDAPLP